MVIKLRMKGEKLRENRIGGGSIRVKKLRNKEVRWEFEARLRRRYSNRMDRKTGEDNVEVVWEELKEGILRSAVEVCGMSRTSRGDAEQLGGVRRYKMQLGQKDSMLNHQTEEAKLAYNEVKKEAKCRVRKAKNEEWIRLGKEMEREAKGMQRSFWSRVKSKERVTTTHIRGLDGELRSGEEALGRWREHFDNLLNGNAGSDEQDRLDVREVQGDEGEIEVEEVKRAVRKLRSEKAGGVCGIQAEMAKTGGHTMVQWLKEVLDVAWKSGKTPPQEWREAIIIPTYSKEGL